MIREQLRQLIRQALQSLHTDGEVQDLDVPVEVLPPRNPDHGDFSTNAALVLANKLGRKPRELAEMLAARIPLGEVVAAVEVAGPGFVNLRLSPAWFQSVVATCCRLDDRYGHTDQGAAQRIQVEFVSANPVGPIHIGNARGGPYGDALAAILAACGHPVEREYYVNDGPDNTQLKLFGSSVQARYRTLAGVPTELPENGYQGGYVADLAQGIWEADGNAHLQVPLDEAGGLHFARLTMDTMVAGLREDCASVGISFDVWFSEQTLHDAGAVERAVDGFVERGVAYEKEGAIWLKTGEFGDDEDRVLRRSTGAYTYIASDVAYAANKFERGFDHLIYVWGPDHAGYVPRLKAAVAALGMGTCEVIIYQQVRFLEDGQPLGLSKRKGAIVSVRDLVEEIGRDATRFFFLMRSVDAHLDFDLDLARKHSQENPVYYVQYAHARICSILREGDQRGIVGQGTQEPDLSLLTHPDELALMRKLSEFPNEVREAAAQRAPHRLTYFARELAQSFHQFYGTCRVLDAEAAALSQARIQLAEATRIVLRNALGLLGISAPDRM